MPDTLKFALWYRSHGWSVFPVIPAKADSEGKDMKRPACKWTEYQKRVASEEEVRTWWTKHPDNRIGIATGATSGVLVVDCDSEKAREILEADYLPNAFQTPIAKSPHGWHYYFKYPDREIRNDTSLQGTEIDIRAEGGFIMAPPSAGLNGKGYAWMKGFMPWKVPLADIPPSLLEFITNAYKRDLTLIKGGVIGGGGEPLSHNKSQRSQQVTGVITQGKRDETLFHIGHHLFKGKMSIEEIQSLLTLIAQKCCDPPFPETEVDLKIRSIVDRAMRQSRNIMQEIREWIEVTSGHFQVTDYHKESQVVTKEDKHAVIVALGRLVKEGLIEKYGTKRGSYRRIEKETQEIKWWEADLKEIPLHLPLQLETYIKVMPKTLSVLAGSQDAGKTAILLNFACQNVHEHRICYLSSEMDANELATRLVSLDMYDPEKLRKIEFRDRSSSFVDVIEPDAINIIDYYEITDNFFKIAEEFRMIRDKLNKGIAFIALQKDPKKQLGRGASFSMEKPRLYLTVDREPPRGNILRVQKAKNWRNSEVNPNGLMREFWIFKGINLKPKTGWEVE